MVWVLILFSFQSLPPYLSGVIPQNPHPARKGWLCASPHRSALYPADIAGVWDLPTLPQLPQTSEKRKPGIRPGGLDGEEDSG
jgi:hypothetical protein